MQKHIKTCYSCYNVLPSREPPAWRQNDLWREIMDSTGLNSLCNGIASLACKETIQLHGWQQHTGDGPLLPALTLGCASFVRCTWLQRCPDPGMYWSPSCLKRSASRARRRGLSPCPKGQLQVKKCISFCVQDIKWYNKYIDEIQ